MSAWRFKEAGEELLRSEKFFSWLGYTNPEWFREYLRPEPEARAGHLLDRLLDLVWHGNGRVLVLTREDKLCAVMGYEHMAWDSRHFGFKCARLCPLCLDGGLEAGGRAEVAATCVDKALDLAHETGVGLLQRRLLGSRLEEIRCLEARGFYMGDNVLTFAGACETNQDVQTVDGMEIGPAGPDDLNAVLKLAAGSFPWSRFFTDPVFGDKARGVYEGMIRNHFRDESADRMIVARERSNVVGFLAYDPDVSSWPGGGGLAEVNLVVVSPGACGRGLGRAIMEHAKNELSRREVGGIEATTWAANRPGLALYQKAGLRVVENIITFHRRM